MPLEHLCCGTKSFIQVGGSYNSIPVSCCSNIGTMYWTFACLINIMLPAIFVYKPFFPNKVSQVCSYLVLLLLFIRAEAASSTSLGQYVDIVQSYTQGFFCQQVLSIILITFLSRPDISTILLQIQLYRKSFNWYLVLVNDKFSYVIFVICYHFT